MSLDLTREQIEDWKSTAFLSAHVMINGEEAVRDFVRLCDLALSALAPAAEPAIGLAAIDSADRLLAEVGYQPDCSIRHMLSIARSALASPVQPRAEERDNHELAGLARDQPGLGVKVGTSATALKGTFDSSAPINEASNPRIQGDAPATPPQAPSEAVARDFKALYMELLYAIGKKHHGESRHETALRYIQQAESPRASDSQACDASPSAGTPEEEK